MKEASKQIPEIIAEVDAAIQDWRQGDVIRGTPFAYLADLDRPITAASKALSKDGSKGVRVVKTKAIGLVLISQTCDIVAKSASAAPFVDAAALVKIEGIAASEAIAGDRPRYVHLPQIGKNWFADLDQVLTLEKGLLVGLSHEHGVEGDHEASAFGTAIGRKYSRFAFPDDVHLAFEILQKRVRSRYRRPNSPEGALLTRVQQIRVSAQPNWQSSQISVTITFILPAGELVNDHVAPVATAATAVWLANERGLPAIAERLFAATDPGDKAVLWGKLVDQWAQLCVPQGVVSDVVAEVVCADEYSVARLWSSERMDLDYLSITA